MTIATAEPGIEHAAQRSGRQFQACGGGAMASADAGIPTII